jgi:hypothetical protein
MNAVEIEQTISELAEETYDSKEFPFQFLVAFCLGPNTDVPSDPVAHKCRKIPNASIFHDEINT